MAQMYLDYLWAEWDGKVLSRIVGDWVPQTWRRGIKPSRLPQVFGPVADMPFWACSSQRMGVA